MNGNLAANPQSEGQHPGEGHRKKDLVCQKSLLITELRSLKAIILCIMGPIGPKLASLPDLDRNYLSRIAILAISPPVLRLQQYQCLCERLNRINPDKTTSTSDTQPVFRNCIGYWKISSISLNGQEDFSAAGGVKSDISYKISRRQN